MSLLPSHHEQFKSKDYWDKFFIEREQKAFEWYGSFQDLKPLVNIYIRNSDNVLVPGCGNSEFSSNFYDFRQKASTSFGEICNMDFSGLVIQEMKKKHQVARPLMKWEIGDMTDMRSLAQDQSYDVVFDKGALDALMSTDTPSTLSMAQSYFNEVSRVLKMGGRFLLVSLAEPFILRAVLQYFLSSIGGWKVEVHRVEAQTPSPFPALLIVATKLNTSIPPPPPPPPTTTTTTPSSSSLVSGSVFFHFNQFGQTFLPSPTSSPPSTTLSLPFSSSLEFISSFQRFHSKCFSLSSLKEGRFEEMEIFIGGGEGGGGEEGREVDSSLFLSSIPKYTLLIVDLVSEEGEGGRGGRKTGEKNESVQGREEDLSSSFFSSLSISSTPSSSSSSSSLSSYSFQYNCVVFFIPLGRENDYQFSSPSGLSQLALQASTRRLIAVKCNKPHRHITLEKGRTGLDLEIEEEELLHASSKSPSPSSSSSSRSISSSTGRMVMIPGAQKELSPIVQCLKPLSPSSSSSPSSPSEKIPFMAVGEDNEWETLYTGVLNPFSPSVGGSQIHCTVEESPAAEPLRESAVMRRLLFLENQQLVQTEVRMLLPSSSSSSSSSTHNNTIKNKPNHKGGGGKKKGKKNKSKKSSTNKNHSKKEEEEEEEGDEEGGEGGVGEEDLDGLVLDLTYLDDHHRVMLTSLSLSLSLSTSLTTSLTTTTSSSTSSPTADSPTGVLIGLGGGVLAQALLSLLSSSSSSSSSSPSSSYFSLYAVELEGGLVQIAREYFGFRPESYNLHVHSPVTKQKGEMERMKVVIGDGIEVMREIREKQIENSITTTISPPSSSSTTTTNPPPPPTTTTTPSSTSNPSSTPSSSTSSSSNLISLPLLPSSPLSFIIIDVDGKDLSLPLSSPPPPFLDPSFLSLLHDCLAPGGLLIMNVVSRSPSSLHSLSLSLARIFVDPEPSPLPPYRPPASLFPPSSEKTSTGTGTGSMVGVGRGEVRGRVVLVRPSEETVNLLLVCQRAPNPPSPSPSASSSVNKNKGKKGGKSTHGSGGVGVGGDFGYGGKRERVVWEERLQDMLKAASQSSDPLQLCSYLSSFQTLYC